MGITKTTNLGLEKPDGDEKVTPEQFNNNFEKIDKECNNYLLTAVATALGLDPTKKPQFNDALQLLAVLNTSGKYSFIIKFKTAQGAPVTSLHLTWTAGSQSGEIYTDNNGVAVIQVVASSLTIVSDPAYIDINPINQTYMASSAIVNADYTVTVPSTSETIVTTTKNVKFLLANQADIHCISGGDNGNGGYCISGTIYGGNGGRAGGQAYSKNISVTKNTSYTFTVGAKCGGTSSALGVTSPSYDSAPVGIGGKLDNSVYTVPTNGSDATVGKFGTSTKVGGGTGGGGSGKLDSSIANPPKTGGQPYGGTGGVCPTTYNSRPAGNDATGYGGGGGGGGAAYNGGESTFGGNGYQGCIIAAWRTV